MASFAFLACEDTGTNPAPTPPNVGCKIVAVSPKISTAEGVSIDPEVEEWVEDQISSGKNDRTIVIVYDMQEPTHKTPVPEFTCYGSYNGSYNSSTGIFEDGCELNGVSMTIEERNEYMEKWRRENPPIYRELDIPEEKASSNAWIVSMTASEIIELAQKYTALALFIQDVNGEPVDKQPGNQNDAPPPPIAAGPDDNGGPRCP